MSRLSADAVLQRSGFQFDLWKWNFIASGGVVSFSIAQKNAAFCAIVPWLSAILFAYWLHQAEAIQRGRWKPRTAHRSRAWSSLVFPAGFVFAPILSFAFGAYVLRPCKSQLLTERQFAWTGGPGIFALLLLTAWFVRWWCREYGGPPPSKKGKNKPPDATPAAVVVELSEKGSIADVQTALRTALDTWNGMTVKSDGVTRLRIVTRKEKKKKKG